MTPARKKRLGLIALMMLGVGIAVTLGLNAFNKNILFFFSPSQIASGEAPVGDTFRVGGMVVDGSVSRSSTDLSVTFDLSDTANQVSVTYTGILPDLFREGQGIVAIGKLASDGLFTAETVLAKHDENYMPPEVAAALKKAGKFDSAPATNHGTDTLSYE